MERHSRTIQALGEPALHRLQEARVAVIGLGAVGGYALEALARVGMQSFWLCDGDRFVSSNMNRQLLATEPTLGRLKAEVARERLLLLNPGIHTEIRTEFLDSEGFDQLFDWKPDIVVDAFDSLPVKGALLVECLKRRVPVFSSMGAARRLRPELIRSGDLMDTSGCPVAKEMRRQVRLAGLDRGVRCVYSPENPGRSSSAPPAAGEDGKRRKVLGSLPTITGIFGLTLAHLAIMYVSSDLD